MKFLGLESLVWLSRHNLTKKIIILITWLRLANKEPIIG